eukprot:350193-Chlamydomonas_euryale.AAC.11
METPPRPRTQHLFTRKGPIASQRVPCVSLHTGLVLGCPDLVLFYPDRFFVLGKRVEAQRVCRQVRTRPTYFQEFKQGVRVTGM